MKIGKVNSFLPVVNSKALEVNTQKANNKLPEYEQMKGLSNICYKPISFGWSMSEHKSNGAVIDPKTKDVSFKLFTYPDTKGVTVTVSSEIGKSKARVYQLKNKGNGIFQTDKKISHEEVKHGDKYFYTVYGSDGSANIVKDPYAFKQERIDGPSTLYDHSLFNWTDSDWFNTNKERVSRKANPENGLTPVNGLKIYELHTGTFTKKGTFDAAMGKLKALKDMGFNAIELMPVENTYSFNWGYDGVDKMAPAEHLGGPDGLKKLIDYAHSIGLNVIMDMVPNHSGPDGSTLKKAGPYLGNPNDFGDSINLEGKDSKFVRDYIVNLAMNWVDNYHCDGLRLDMTKYMNSDYTMKMIAAELNRHFPDAFLIAEDARDKTSVDENGNYWHNEDEIHDKRVTNPLLQSESGEGLSPAEHIQAIQKITSFDKDVSLGRLGFDSEWDFNFFHTLKDCLYGKIDLDKMEKSSYCAQTSTKYVMSHDEQGNHEGVALIAKLMVPMLHLHDNMEPTATMNRDAQFTSEKLATMLQTGALDKYSTEGITSKRWLNSIEKSFQDEVLKPLGIKENSNITYDSIRNAYNKAFSKNKLAYARTYSTPGPVMVFQGDESQDLTPFRFFRQFSDNPVEENLHREKGYDTGKAAFLESKLGTIKYSTTARSTMKKFRNLIKDLNEMRSQNPALVDGKLVIEETVKHPFSNVIGTLAAKDDNQIYSITNFSDIDYPRENSDCYYIKFPEGKWVEILNTDDKKYNGNGNTNNSTPIISDGMTNSRINLAANTTAIFKRID